MSSYRSMRKSQAFAGTLGALPMAIPREVVCILFAPSGTVSTSASFLNGSNALSIDWSAYGPDSSFPLDGSLFGYVSASGSGTIQYAFLPRDLAQAVRFDTVSPLLKGTLTVDGTVVISGTPSVSIIGTPSVTITSGTLNATITNANLTVTNTVSSNGTDTVPPVEVLSQVTPINGYVLTYTVPTGKRLRLEGARASSYNHGTAPATQTQLSLQLFRASATGFPDTYYNLFNDTTSHALGLGDQWVEWLEYSPPSGTFASAGSGAPGTVAGITGYSLANVLYLYPGDFLALVAVVSGSTGTSMNFYLQALGRLEPL